VVIIYSPAYVVAARQNCWKCESGNEVVTLACTGIGVDGNAIERAERGEAFLLSYISEMPGEVFQYVTSLAPTYRKLYSKTAEHEYYANVCKCGANFGDWFLFSEPDAAWFPKDESGVVTTRVLPVPLAHPFEVECDYGTCKMAGVSGTHVALNGIQNQGDTEC
jgi:hypothetical protein